MPLVERSADVIAQNTLMMERLEKALDSRFDCPWRPTWPNSGNEADAMTYPANYSLNQQLRRVLYTLKRQYGGAIVIYQNGVVTTDTKTGEVARTKTATQFSGPLFCR